MDISQITKNVIILAQNPGLRQDIQNRLHDLNMRVMRTTGKPQAVLDSVNDPEFFCDILFIDTIFNEMEALEFLETFRKSKKTEKNPYKSMT